VKERPIEAMHDSDAGGVVRIGLAGVEFLAVAIGIGVVAITVIVTGPSFLKTFSAPLRRSRGGGTPLLCRDDIIRIRPASASTSASSAPLKIARPQPPQFTFILAQLGRGSSRSGAADLRDAEDGFPPIKQCGAVGVGGGRVAEAGGGEGALGPAVVDAGEVPLDLFGSGVAVELVADVDEMLHRGDVDVVDRGEVEDDGFQGRERRLVCGGEAAAAGARVVPGSVLRGVLVGFV